MFHVGQLVVCVRTWTREAGKGYGDERGPVAGHVYTVREYDNYPPPNVNAGRLSLRLCEIVNPVRSYAGVQSWEQSFHAERFRPVDPLRLEVFRRMLAPTPKKEAHKAPESV